MVFSSVTFLCLFLPVTLLLHGVCRDIRWKNGLLLAASLLFYAWGEPVWILAMLFTVGVNYAAARLISRAGSPGKRRLWLVLSLAVSLGFLFYFKYSLFTVNLFRQLFGAAALTEGPALPIGISFYTFQVITYTVDVYREKTEIQKNPLTLLLYVSLFPQLIAGPIVQYGQVREQLTHREVTSEDLSAGFIRLGLGLGKKVLLANLFAQALAGLPTGGEMSWLAGWATCIFFSLQIYFDFSGYSDMAIGMGRMMGFRFPENFDHPYSSASISEFWRRWHISLGAFFREYVYIPLGGNRVSRGRLVFNLLVVWTLTGLWHGASLNFAVWGLYYGLLIVGERLLEERLQRIPAVLRHVGTLLLVMAGWVIFYYESLGAGVQTLGCMLGLGAAGFSDPNTVYTLKRFCLPLAAGLLCCPDWPALLHTRGKRLAASRLAQSRLLPLLASGGLLLLSLCFLIGQTYNPFLYFRF